MHQIFVWPNLSLKDSEKVNQVQSKQELWCWWKHTWWCDQTPQFQLLHNFLSLHIKTLSAHSCSKNLNFHTGLSPKSRNFDGCRACSWEHVVVKWQGNNSIWWRCIQSTWYERLQTLAPPCVPTRTDTKPHISTIPFVTGALSAFHTTPW